MARIKLLNTYIDNLTMQEAVDKKLRDKAKGSKYMQGYLDCRLSNTTQCWQANLEAPTKKSERREEFWNDYQRKGIDFVMKKYGTVPMKTKIKNKLLRIIGGGTQKVVPVMLITPKGGQHNELEAA